MMVSRVLHLASFFEKNYRIFNYCKNNYYLLSAGHKAIAIPSATLLSKKDAELLLILNSKLLIKFEMFPDRDAPGERLFLQLQKVLPGLVHHQLPQGCKDFSEYYLLTDNPFNP